MYRYYKKYCFTVIFILTLLLTSVLLISCERKDLYEFARNNLLKENVEETDNNSENETSDGNTNTINSEYYFYAVKKTSDGVYLCVSDGNEYYREYQVQDNPPSIEPLCTVTKDKRIIVQIPSDKFYVGYIDDNGFHIQSSGTLIATNYPITVFNNEMYVVSNAINNAVLYKYTGPATLQQVYSFDNYNFYMRTITRVGNLLMSVYEYEYSEYNSKVLILNLNDFTATVKTISPLEAISVFFLHFANNSYYMGYTGYDSTTIYNIDSAPTEIASQPMNCFLYAYATDFNNDFWAALMDQSAGVSTKLAKIENGNWVIKASTNVNIQYDGAFPRHPRLMAFSPTKLLLFVKHYNYPNHGWKYIFIYDIQANQIYQLTEDTFPGIQDVSFIAVPERD